MWDLGTWLYWKGNIKLSAQFNAERNSCFCYADFIVVRLEPLDCTSGRDRGAKAHLYSHSICKQSVLRE